MKIILAATAALIATNAEATEEIALSIREPFDIGMTSTVHTSIPSQVRENETVSWGHPNVVYIGRQLRPCKIVRVDGEPQGQWGRKVIFCHLGVDRD
jgi:hypothetical protein